MKKNYLLLAVFLFGIFFAGISPSAQAQTRGTMGIKLYFPKDDPNADIELVAVERTIKKTSRVADAALRELFKGANEAERKKGLTSAYSAGSIVTGREECSREKMRPLGAYYRGVSIKKGIATVNFRPEAECYLQSAITMMNYVMNPIEATLKQFKGIKEVRYALNGKVITEWDA